MRTLAEIKHANNDGDWCVIVNYDEICVSKDGEHRIYDLDEIDSVEHSQTEDSITLHCVSGDYYVVKFEENNFLVIDKFDEDDEHLEEVGCFVFGED